MRYFYFTLIVFLTYSVGYSQCSTTSISSLIPNPSFESYSACPTDQGQMSRASTWIQASSATSDYFNCSFRTLAGGFYSIPPTPIPNGTGYVGFINGNVSGIYKEYVGACLTGTMLANTSYTIKFFVNADVGTNPNLDMAIFGSTSCANLPFSTSTTSYNCPTAYPGWVSLSTQSVVVSKTGWTQVTMTFTPTTNIRAIVLGPSCATPPPPTGGFTNYYYMDNLILNTTTSFTPPTASAGANKTTTCTTPSQVLNGGVSGGTAGYTYSWSPSTGLNNPNIASPTANPSSNTTYTLTVTDANSCTDTDQTVVTVNKAAPTASAGLNKITTCTSPTAVLNGSGGGSYSWSNGAPNVQNSTVNPASTTTYTLTVTASNGCTDTDQATVTVDKAAPIASAGLNKITTCTTPTAVLDGSGGGSYNWNNGAANIQSPTVNPTSTTTYTLTVTASNGCTDTDQVLVTVDEGAPTANAGPNILIDCATTSGAFTAAGSGTYSWSTPSGTVSGSTINIDNTSSQGTYTLTVTGSNGCTNTDVTTLTIDQVDPVSNAGQDQISNCATPTVSLDGSGSTGTGISYNWSGPGILSGGNTNTASANMPGTYTLTVTGTNFCTDSDDVIVNPDNNYPNADAGLDQIIDCNNLTANMDGSGSDSGANFTYSWTTSNGNIISSSNANMIEADIDGLYVLEVTNTTNGCASTDDVLVIQDTVTPVIQIANQSLTIDCNNPSVALDATGSSGVGNTYNWVTSDGNILSGANTSTPIVNLDGNYVLTAVSSNGCSNLNSLSVTVLIDTVSPTLSFLTPDTLTCNVLDVEIDGSNSQSGVTYTWSSTLGNIIGNNNGSSITTNSIGFYTLEVMSSNGCITIDSIEVISSTPPNASIIAEPTEGEVPLLVDFSSDSEGTDLTYYWDFGTDLDTSSIENPDFTYEIEGEYEVVLTVEDQYGCIDMDTIKILANELSAVIIPNIFTPNGDGDNEVFRILGGGVKTLDGGIYNRWGQQVYSWNTIYGGWDGRTLSGKEAGEGTYYYVIKILFNKGNEETFKGNLMLAR